MNLFRVGGIQLALHGSFFLLLAFAAYAGWSEVPEAPLHGLAWMLAYVVLIFACVTLHEFGHAFAGRCFGVRVSRILLMPIGGMAQFDAIPRRPIAEIAIALAGPAVNVVLVALLWLVVPFPTDWNPFYFELRAVELFRHLLLLNAIMAVFNLVPVFPMDGGRVLRALLATRFDYVRATFLAATVAKVLAIVAIGASLYYRGYDGIITAVLFLFIFIAGERELQLVRRIESEDNHWRDTLARLHTLRPVIDAPPPAEPPPIPPR